LRDGTVHRAGAGNEPSHQRYRRARPGDRAKEPGVQGNAEIMLPQPSRPDVNAILGNGRQIPNKSEAF
jgi:hypothetical protein